VLGMMPRVFVDIMGCESDADLVAAVHQYVFWFAPMCGTSCICCKYIYNTRRIMEKRAVWTISSYWKERYTRKKQAAKVIQRRWRDAIWDPHCELGRRMVLRR
jgi:hypothetical protein